MNLFIVAVNWKQLKCLIMRLMITKHRLYLCSGILASNKSEQTADAHNNRIDLTDFMLRRKSQYKNSIPYVYSFK